jgi:hypothetical protein
MDTAIQKLIEFIESKSPFLWETLYKQVYIEIWLNFVWFAVCGGLVVASYKLYKYGLKKKEEDEFSMWEMAAVGGCCGVVILSVVAVMCFNNGLVRLINPDYYAITLILLNLK